MAHSQDLIGNLFRFTQTSLRQGDKCKNMPTHLVLEMVQVTNAQDSMHSQRSDSSVGSTYVSEGSDLTSTSVSSSASIAPKKSLAGTHTYDCAVDVGRDILESMGLSIIGDTRFHITWKERNMPNKRRPDFNHRLQVFGDYAVSVDGIIAPNGGITDIYEGSQISIMCREPGTDQYKVLMILRAHFEQVEEIEHAEHARTSDMACWGACWLRK